jgi:hypothetical protein
MFIPNTSGMLTRPATAKRDVFGQLNYAPPVSVPCTVIKLDVKAAKTPIRSDASASHGASEETVIIGKILFPAGTQIDANDKFEILGVAVRVVGVQPRNDIFGDPEHVEVDVGAWVR